MPRWLRALAALSLTTASLVAVQAPAQAGPSAQGHVDIHEVLAGSRETFVFTVTNTSNGTPIGVVEIQPPNGDFTIVDAAAQGWTAQIDSSSGKTITTFTGGPIAMGASAEFYLLVDAAQLTSNDSGSAWSLKIRQSPGSITNGVSNDQPDAFKSHIRVLSIDYLGITGPEGALDYTVTQGQQITLESAISNYGTQQINGIDPELIVGSGDSWERITPSVQLPSGQTAIHTHTYSAGSPGTRELVAKEDKDCCNAIRASTDEITIQPAPAFTYSAASLSPPSSVSQATQVFSVSVAKSDSPAVYLDPTLTKLSFRNNNADVFSTTLAEAATIDEGAMEAGLTFAPLTIPNVSNRAYGVRLTLAGEDDNGKVFSQVIDTADSFVKEDAMPYAKPQIAAPQGQVDPDGLPVVKDGDTITLSGDIKTSGAPNAPLDPTAQILDCDLAVLDADLARVGSIDVPLAQCQNTGGHFSGQVAPASIGVTDGFLRLEAQVKKAVGGVASPPDQVSNLIAVDNDVPRPEYSIVGCGPLSDITCLDTNTIRVRFSEYVKGLMLPLDFTIAGNAVAAVTSECGSDTLCDEFRLTTALPVYEVRTYQVAVDFPDLAARPIPTDGAGHRSQDASLQSTDESLQGDSSEAPDDTPVQAESDPFAAEIQLQESPSGQILVVDANILQAFVTNRDGKPRGAGKFSCENSTDKQCDAAQRQIRFARRIRALADKPAAEDSDGMGGLAPDVIVLQESLCSNAKRIAARLNNIITIPNPAPDNDDPVRAQYTKGKCRSLSATVSEAKKAQRKDGTKTEYILRTEADTAFLYNRLTMRRLDRGATITTKYSLEHRRRKNCGNKIQKNDPKHCVIKYKQHYMQSFEELSSGDTVALVSTHLITGEYMRQDGGDDETPPPADANEPSNTHEERTQKWVEKLATEVEVKYPSVAAYVIGGDLNIQRCEESQLAPEPLGEPEEPQVCTERPFWGTLAQLGYQDAIYEQHGNPLKGNTQGDLDRQFQDGRENDGVTPHPRGKRIDYIFQKNLTAQVGASTDITCGMGTQTDPEAEPNCDDFRRNDEYYSDHRLLWALLGL